MCIRDRGNIVAHKKREAGVVIFKIEGVSHSLRELIHEAKNTLVGTGAGTVHEIGLKIEPHILPFPLAQPHRPCGSVLRPQGQREPGIIPCLLYTSKRAQPHAHGGL